MTSAVTTGKWALVAPKIGTQDSVFTFDLDGLRK
jgi:hypothetical protein